MKSDLKYLIECYDAALKISDEQFEEYTESDDIDLGVCYKGGELDNIEKIDEEGKKYIRNNMSLFDSSLRPLRQEYWFITPFRAYRSDGIELARKALEARKVVLEEILKTL